MLIIISMLIVAKCVCFVLVEMSAAGGPVKSDTGVTHTELLRNPSKVLLLTVMINLSIITL